MISNPLAMFITCCTVIGVFLCFGVLLMAIGKWINGIFDDQDKEETMY